MWYAIVFISYLNLVHFELDLTEGYSYQNQCMEKTEEKAKELSESLLEYSENPFKSPKIYFKCKVLPILDI